MLEIGRDRTIVPIGKDQLARWSMAGALTVVVALVAFSYGFTPLGDENDLWWHLKTGKLMVEQGRLPAKDPFASTSAETTWRNHEWLSQWAIYRLYAWFEPRVLGGLRAVILAKAIVVTLAFLLVFRLAAQRAGDATLAALLTLVAISVSRFSIPARPPVISYLLGALCLWLLYGVYWRYAAARSRWVRLGLLPAIMVAWVNLHGGFLMGLVLIVFFAAGAFADGLIEWLRGGRRAVLWQLDHVVMARGFGWCAAACFVASFVNPSGPLIYGMYLRVMGDAQLVSSISELQPPSMLYARAFEAMIVAFVVVGGLARRRLPATVDYLLLVFFLHQALLHVRHLPLFAIVATPILAWQIRGFYDELRIDWRRYWRPGFAAATVVLALWMVGTKRPGWPTSSLTRNIALAHGTAYYPAGYPSEICDFLLAHSYPGRLFNEVNFAGYLIWRLSPERYQVFTDNRFDIFSGKFLAIANTIAEGVETASGQKLWREWLDRWEINLAIVDGYKPLNHRLQQSGEWKLLLSQPWEHDDSRKRFNLWMRTDPIESNE